MSKVEQLMNTDWDFPTGAVRKEGDINKSNFQEQQEGEEMAAGAAGGADQNEN